MADADVRQSGNGLIIRAGAEIIDANAGEINFDANLTAASTGQGRVEIDATGGGGGAPSGPAGGDLTGTYPNPEIAALAVTDAEVATANKDGAAGTPSMRTLGTSSTQACAGDDARLSDARSPTVHQSTHRSGQSDAITGSLDANARITIRKNGGADVGARRRLNLIEGSNVTITTTDDSTDEEVDVTIAASSGGSITNSSVSLAANYSNTGSNSWGDITGMSLSLVAGTWLVTLHASARKEATTSVHHFLRITDGTNNYASGQISHTSMNPHSVQMALTAIIILGSTTSIKAQYAISTATGIVLSDLTAPMNSGANATTMTAIKLS